MPKPQFTMSDLKASIPAHLWEKDTAKSLGFLLRDTIAFATLSTGAVALNAWYLWPLYWVLQGSLFWAIFNIGHDCGHGSFSNNKRLSTAIGLITHSFLIVPFHGFRKIHKIHHTFHGHPEKDESWKPLPRSAPGWLTRAKLLFRTKLPFMLVSFPLYLWFPVSHFDPGSKFFAAADKGLVLVSNACILAFLCILCRATHALGACTMVNLSWLSTVSYLHHHGASAPHRIPWYRGEEWSYLRGSLSTVDRYYGVFNELHHNIGTHVVHHLFPQIPHYNLAAATECVKPVLGPFYREPEKCRGWFPTHLLKPLITSLSNDPYVPASGDTVFYD
eukprot:gene12740-15987_t